MRTVAPFAACWNKRGGKTDYYPASGFRDSDSGGLNGVGSYGYSWSNTPVSATSVSGSYLDFSSSYMGPEVYADRASGLPVRCVQE